MQLLKQDLFLDQPYSYCSHIGRIQSAYQGNFSTDEYGFRRSYLNGKPLSYEEFVNLRACKASIFGNSVAYGVAVIEDKKVLGNILSSNYSIPAYNFAVRASTVYQDYLVLSRLLKRSDSDVVIWIAGLNDVIATMLGDYSHPLFPPWFGENRLQTPHHWKRPSLSFSSKESISLLAEAMAALIDKVSCFSRLIFAWQPLFSERKEYLTSLERSNISLFFKSQAGSLGSVYASSQLLDAYKSLKQEVSKYFSQHKRPRNLGGCGLRFLDLSEGLPPGCLADVTHITSKGHAWIAHQVHKYVRQAEV